MTDEVLRVGNCSGFYGDRFSAVQEMLEGGPLDVLTGDYLAELTMLILGRDLLKDPSLGYAKTFLKQMREHLGTAVAGGVKVVVNAGGLNPVGLAEALRDVARESGVAARVACVIGDDLRDRAAELDLGEGVLTANAYLGGWGVARCLEAGADVVVTGRVTDAALVVGPAAHRFGWARDDWDALAGAVVAGHVIECGCQATGGNYSFFTEHLDDLTHPGFPIAEIAADGSSVITKHDGTGGVVDVGTVTAQLLYEIQTARYANPDVTARFDTIELRDDGPDRVRISGVRGEPPPPDLKVATTALGGHRNEMTFVLTGLDVEEKAALVRRQFEAAVGDDGPHEVRWTLARTDQRDAPTQQQASALLRVQARDADPAKVGRAFSSALIELALASYPGFTGTAPPGSSSPVGIYRPASVLRSEVPQVAVLPDGTEVDVGNDAPRTRPLEPVPPPELPASPGGDTTRVPLGRVFGARSGDKGGAANIGVWARDDAGYAWLANHLTEAAVRQLLPEAADLPVSRHLLPNLRAVNVLVEDILDEGVASATRFDPQAKGLAEWLRSREVDLPVSLLADG